MYRHLVPEVSSPDPFFLEVFLSVLASDADPAPGDFEADSAFVVLASLPMSWKMSLAPVVGLVLPLPPLELSLPPPLISVVESSFKITLHITKL